MWTISQGREISSVWGNSVSPRAEICLSPWECPQGTGTAGPRCWESAPISGRVGFLLFQDTLPCLFTMQPALGWTEKWARAGFKDLGPDVGGHPPPQFVLIWCRQWEDGQGSEPRWRRERADVCRLRGSWRSLAVAESAFAGLDLAMFSLNPALSRVSTLLLNLLRFAGLNRILVITWMWDWLLWFRYTLTKRNPLIFLYSCLAVFLTVCLA